MARVIRKQHQKPLDEKKELLIQELIELINQTGYEVRIEKGSFKGGFCLVRESKVLLINKNLEQDKKINFLLKNLSEIGTDEIFIKPNIREMLDNQSFI